MNPTLTLLGSRSNGFSNGGGYGGGGGGYGGGGGFGGGDKMSALGAGLQKQEWGKFSTVPAIDDDQHANNCTRPLHHA